VNQGILWTVIVVLVLIVLGLLFWNAQTREPLAESPIPEEPFELPSPSPLVPVFSPTPTPSPTASITVSGQTPGNAVTIDSVTLTEPGFIAIHTDQSGKPGPVIGNSDLLPAGTFTGTSVKLTRRSKNGETLYAMLHTDVNGNGVYEFPGVDVPTVDSAGQSVTVPFTIGTASPSPSPAAGTTSLKASPVASPTTASPSPASAIGY
jgi:hypothetical protein